MQLTGVWFPPAMLGALLILFGVAICIRPELLAYLVAAAFIGGGLFLLAIAAQMRLRVSYHRIDPPSP